MTRFLSCTLQKTFSPPIFVTLKLAAALSCSSLRAVALEFSYLTTVSRCLLCACAISAHQLYRVGSSNTGLGPAATLHESLRWAQAACELLQKDKERLANSMRLLSTIQIKLGDYRQGLAASAAANKVSLLLEVLYIVRSATPTRLFTIRSSAIFTSAASTKPPLVFRTARGLLQRPKIRNRRCNCSESLVVK
jgi:hypothetical protein